MSGQKFTVDGNALYFEVAEGIPENPPLFFVHGFTMSAHMWRTTIDHLQHHFYCVALDLLGHGRSAVNPQGDYSIAAHGQRILALADHLGVAQFSVVGHSMGGQIALLLASQLAPERITKLVHVDGVVSGKVTPAMARLFSQMKLMHGTPLSPLTEIFGRTVGTQVKLFAPMFFGLWWHDFKARDFAWWRTDRELTMRHGIHHVWKPGIDAIYSTDLTADLANITCPVLSIFGREDNVVPVSEGQLLAAKAPHGELAIIEQCGHLPMFERTAEYLAILEPFLLNK